MDRKISQKKVKIQNLIASITRIETFVATYEPTLQHELQPRIDRLEDLFETFESLSTEYESFSDDLLPESLSLRAKVEEQYLRVKGALLSKLPTPTPPTPGTPPAGANQHLKLPAIELPKFDGNLSEWITFHDSFNAIIHSSADISLVQKLQYLRSSVRGEALKCIEALPISAANYTLAWETLLARYQNKTLLLKKHLHGLTSTAKSYGKGAALGPCLEEFNRNVKILEQQGEPVQHWSTLLIHLLSLKIEPRILRDWEEARVAEPTYKQFVDFLTKKVRIQEALSMGADRASNQKPPNAGSRVASHATVEKKVPRCAACNEGHYLTKCGAFEKMTHPEKFAIVQSKRLCSNCLHGGHFAKNCQSNLNCRTCSKRHHTWLHPGHESQRNNQANDPVSKDPPADKSEKGATSTTASTLTANTITRNAIVFLSTAVLIIVDRNGKEYLARALLDSASQANILSKRMQEILKLDLHKSDIEITGVDGKSTRIQNTAMTHVRSRINNMSVPIEFLLVNKVTNNLPSVTISSADWKIPPEVQLADPEFHTSKNVDMIIGAEHYFKFIKNGRIQLESHLPMLIESDFGWLVSGKAEANINTYSVVCHASTLQNLENQMEKFWQIEEIQSQNYSIEERKCEDLYKETTSRTEEGRYMVQLPKRDNFQNAIGESKATALKRLECLERKFEKNPGLKTEYDKVMLDYIKLGHMELLEDESTVGSGCYLPHHAVLKEDSTTTKVRVVFDGSARTSTGYSLNQSLLVGPVVQQELLSIVTRFRKHRIALIADVEKMYRQVLVSPEDRALQRILYRFQRDQPVKIFQLNTVTFGLGPSSFLATRTLLQLAEDEGEKYPMAKEVLKKDFYVDDLISGAESIEKALKLRDELNALMAKGGFNLRKWGSNSLDVLADLAPGQSATQSTLKFQSDESIKTLGILWEPSTDCFRFDINIRKQEKPLTKRSILSQIAQLFDPLGLIAPVILKSKIIMQQLWSLALEWDDVVPLTISHQWELIYKQLKDLTELRIPRYAFAPESKVELHCFVDASTLGYGACIYGKSTNAEGVKVCLLASKSKVAPLKRVTLPRLELCAALLGARLYEKVSHALDMNLTNSYFWSDSTVVLHWLKASPHNWKTYVANRVSEIQSITHQFKWRHVSGLDNPADLVSRGLFPEEIVSNRKWFEGPEWLMDPENSWPGTTASEELGPSVDLELKSTMTIQVATLKAEPHPLFKRFSVYDKLISVTAYCLRFGNNCRNKQDRIKTATLSVEERNKALTTLVKLVQAEEFAEELKHLRKGQPISARSKLKLLNPFLDESGIIRVGGRLRASKETYSVKHPILLTGFHPFTKLLIKHQHRKLLHAGISLVLATLREEFWPLNGRRAIRSVIRSCYYCTRAHPQPMQQPIGQLPTPRTTPSRPFTHTGIDYCGPVFIKAEIRKATILKAYIAIFVCFSTKAVHIELVGKLSTDAFILALRRFIARKGIPLHIYSDNGTNFIGAKNELHALYQMLHSKEQEAIINALGQQSITWHLIPPRAPNFGGLWEAAVKVAKKHLLKQIGDLVLYYEDLITLLAQVEACMNSRPLCALTEECSGFQVLTPGHFLIGSSLQALPEIDVRKLPVNRLNHYQLIQQRLQNFWDRWRTEYLREMNRQATVNPSTTAIKVGQMVILEDYLLAPCSWPLARIEALHPGSDGVCRVVTVRTGSGTFKRPISKICPLPATEEEDNPGSED